MAEGMRRRRSPVEDRGTADPESEAIISRGADASAENRDDRRSTAVVVNPFWSERARTEAIRTRPEILDQAAASAGSGRGSSSTELRPVEDDQLAHPQTQPVSFGPGVAAVAPARDEQPLDRENGELDSEGPPRDEDRRAGMRPGERAVVETMRDMLADLFEQNRQILEQNRLVQGRLEKLEDDAFMKSASSGGNRDSRDVAREFVEASGPFSSNVLAKAGGTGHHERDELAPHLVGAERGSVDYHEGFETGSATSATTDAGTARA